jgi:hypothetical protein
MLLVVIQRAIEFRMLFCKDINDDDFTHNRDLLHGWAEGLYKSFDNRG